MKLIDELSVRRVLAEHRAEKLPMSAAYKIAKILKKTEDDAEFYRTKLKEIVETYGEKSPDGKFLHSKSGNIIIQNGKAEECAAKIKELDATEVDEIEIRFAFEELSSATFSADELLLLDNYICQD